MQAARNLMIAIGTDAGMRWRAGLQVSVILIIVCVS
jgi:hypothetical protein